MSRGENIIQPITTSCPGQPVDSNGKEEGGAVGGSCVEGVVACVYVCMCVLVASRTPPPPPPPPPILRHVIEETLTSAEPRP